MVVRITYGDKEPGDQFTADNADEIMNVVNGLGTAADYDVGSDPGDIPQLDGEGKVPLTLLPEVFVSGADGDVRGPSSSTDGRVAVFSGTDGKTIAEGTAVQLVPTGTNNYWFQMVAGVPTFVAPSALVTSLGTLVGSARLPYTSVHDLDAAGAGALYVAALLAHTSAAAGSVLRVNDAADDIEAVESVPENPTPGSASSSSNAITLDFEEAGAPISERQTTTTEDIDTITVDNLPLYAYGSWRVTFGSTHEIQFPSDWFVSTAAPAGLYTGANADVVQFILYHASTGPDIYHVGIGNPMQVVP